MKCGIYCYIYNSLQSVACIILVAWRFPRRETPYGVSLVPCDLHIAELHRRCAGTHTFHSQGQFKHEPHILPP